MSTTPIVRGTLIVCDQVYQDRSGKFIIAGTYSAWRTRDDDLRLAHFNAYIRLQVEQPGDYPCRIAVADRLAPPHHPPLVSGGFTAHVTADHLPVFEVALRLPELHIRAPRPLRDREPGSVHGIRTLVTLTVDTADPIDVASCPLDFLFTGPPV
jgi:hypothetical protein